MVCPWLFVKVMMILLKVALICASPTGSMVTIRFLLTFLLLAIISSQLLFSSFLFISNRLALTLTCTRVVLSTLATNGQMLTMTKAAIATDIHQALDIQLNLGTK